MKLEFLIPYLACLLFITPTMSQEERIINYDVQLEVHEDRSITVLEYIKVYATGDRIKRGPTRSLPGKRDLEGKSVKMKYDIEEVEKDGKAEPYHIQNSGNGKTLYIGQKEVILSPGEYEYKIKYHVPNQIGLYDDYDEIYWNAIGNDVEFKVENASCRVQVPSGAKVLQHAAYVGAYGSEDQSFTTTNEGGVIDYRTTRILQPKESFSVGVGFEKGYLKEPSLFQKFGTLILVILGFLLLSPYYIYTWWRYGQDPPTPPSYPIYHSPDDLSAASINYIKKGSYESKSFTASIIDLAIKGYLRIEEEEKKGFFSRKKTYSLIKLKDTDVTLPSEEKALHHSLFIASDIVQLDGTYDALMEKASEVHRANLSAQHKSFITKGDNSKFLVIPIIATMVIIGLAILLFSKSTHAQGANLIALVAMVPIMIIGFILYGYLIKKPSEEKLELRSRIGGFLMYLDMAEKDRLNLLNPPELTPTHFEEALPYAFALGVEHKWSEKFKTILDAANYRPEWNNSAHPTLFVNNFGRDFGSTVSSASTQPQQSSGGGSGGGGFSGGGGGGGGVGGW